MSDDTADLLAALQSGSEFKSASASSASTTATAPTRRERSDDDHDSRQQQLAPKQPSSLHQKSVSASIARSNSVKTGAAAVPTLSTRQVTPQQQPRVSTLASASNQTPAVVSGGRLTPPSSTGAAPTTRTVVLPGGKIVRVPSASPASQPTGQNIIVSSSSSSFPVSPTAPAVMGSRQSSTASTSSLSSLSSSGSFVSMTPALLTMKNTLVSQFEEELSRLWQQETEAAAAAGKVVTPTAAAPAPANHNLLSLAEISGGAVDALITRFKGNVKDCTANAIQLISMMSDKSTGPPLLRRLRTGALTSTQLVTTPVMELLSDEQRKRNDELKEDHLLSRDQLYMLKLRATPSPFFKCRHCGSRECVFEQKQTSRGDEGSTCFVTCTDCRRSFKTRQ